MSNSFTGRGQLPRPQLTAPRSVMFSTDKAMQMTLHILDREKGLATFVSGDKRHRATLTAESLPEGLRIGDCVEIAIFPDLEKLAEVRRYVQETLDSIAVGDFSNLRNARQQTYKHVIYKQLLSLVRENRDGFVLKNLEHASDQIATVLCGKR